MIKNDIQPGKRYGKLTVVEYHGSKRSMRYWRCQCDCGRERIVEGPKLRERGDKAACLYCSNPKRSHGHTVGSRRSPTMSSYSSMIARTTQASNPAFAYYQKQGVQLCARWRYGEGQRSGFECFLDDMGERPSMQHSIDRWPNTSGNYEPGNCRWATKREQANNRVTNRRVEYRGRHYTIAELARATGICRHKLHHRVSKGWTIEDAVHRPNSTGRRTDLGR